MDDACIAAFEVIPFEHRRGKCEEDQAKTAVATLMASYCLCSSPAYSVHGALSEYDMHMDRLLPDLTDHLQCHLLRDIFGFLPFRSTSIDPSCKTPAVLALAHSAYENRLMPEGQLNPARLCLLADALRSAGCTDNVLLDHLRGPGPHVRGCWALDRILKKERFPDELFTF